MAKFKTTADLRVRAQKIVDPKNVLGVLPFGSVIEANVIGDWAETSVKVGGADIVPSTTGPGHAYVASQYLESADAPTPPQPPPTVGGFKLGVNALSNVREAMVEAQHGCRHFLIMDSFAGASQLKQAYPDATVMVRRWLQSRPTVEQMIGALEGAGDKNLIYTGTNEADVMGQSGQGLVDRAKFDLAVAARIKQISGATYAAGTFSVGTPDITSPTDCQIIRELYAPAYNAGLIAFDMHLYSPDLAHIDKPNEWIWFERRWEALFTKCGFDPTIRSIYCSEAGVDEGNVGGFSAHHISNEAFKVWAQKYIAMQKAPLIVNGTSYPSPIRGAAFFQLGGNGDPRWAGYDVTPYLPEMRQLY